MKLSKADAKLHAEAMALVLASDTRKLTFDEREFVLRHFHPAANHVVTTSGAFFTPEEVAEAFTIQVDTSTGPLKVIDLCAGIGCLAYHVWMARRCYGDIELVCVENNPDYVRVGKAVLPEATWILADVFDVVAYRHLGPFAFAISNPPFGSISDGKKNGSKKVEDDGRFVGKYKGGKFEYKVIEVAREVAMFGAFIVPQSSAPYLISGQRHATRNPMRDYVEFEEVTGIHLEPSSSDLACVDAQWRDVKVAVEIITADLDMHIFERQRNSTAVQVAPVVDQDAEIEPGLIPGQISNPTVVPVQSTLF